MVKNKNFLIIAIFGFLAFNCSSGELSLSIGEMVYELDETYILQTEFTIKSYPKFLKYEKGVLVSTIFIKPIAECLKYCLSDYIGEENNEINVKRLEYKEKGDIYSSLFFIKNTWSGDSNNMSIGLIYNDKVMIQIINNDRLWHYWNDEKRVVIK
jgi:hypothetical protein